MCTARMPTPCSFAMICFLLLRSTNALLSYQQLKLTTCGRGAGCHAAQRPAAPAPAAAPRSAGCARLAPRAGSGPQSLGGVAADVGMCRRSVHASCLRAAGAMRICMHALPCNPLHGMRGIANEFAAGRADSNAMSIEEGGAQSCIQCPGCGALLLQ